MRCMVCGTQHDCGECPSCRFPLVEIAGSDYEAGLRELQLMAEQYRNDLLEEIDLGVLTYRWKDEDGTLIEAERIPLFFATGTELLKEEQWCEQCFARIPDEEEISVSLVIRNRDIERTVTVPIPNLLQSELQKIGLKYSGDMHVSLLLGNDSDSSCSQPVALLEN